MRIQLSYMLQTVKKMFDEIRIVHRGEKSTIINGLLMYNCSVFDGLNGKLI